MNNRRGIKLLFIIFPIIDACMGHLNTTAYLVGFMVILYQDACVLDGLPAKG